MPRKPMTEEEKQRKREERAKVKEEQQKQYRLECDFNEMKKRLPFTPEPTYFFKVGDKVEVGRLVDVTIAEVFENGKFYKIEYSVIHTNYGHPYREDGLFMYKSWMDLRPINEATESFIQNENTRIYFSQRHLGDIMSKAYVFGLDMNPDYQRDYVWEEKDKVSLIDSIFSNVDIGKFCFIKHSYADEYLYEVLDGKQRIRTILDFYENRFAYKGKYFNDLCAKDKSWFENYPIVSAVVQPTNRKEVLQYFLLLNRSGKKMSEEHLQEIQKLYEEI